MTNIRKDHTMEFPAAVPPKRPNIFVRVFRLIRSGNIHAGDK